MSDSNKQTSKYHVPNLERALVILELLASRSDGLTLAEIVDHLQISKNSVFRISTTLVNHGYLQRDEETKKFTLTRKFLTLGYAAICEYTLIEKSLDVMRELRDKIKETILIGTLTQNEGIVLEQVPGTYPFKFIADVGLKIPLHTAAPTKAILAYLSPKQLDGYLAIMNFTRHTRQTITNQKEFISELQRVREKGYAVDQAEQLDGVHCIGAPVFNQHGNPIAAIWTTGPSERLKVSGFDSTGTLIKLCAEKISKRLGYNLLKHK
jgi:DNA-binding IclR family transcriptional regulator